MTPENPGFIEIDNPDSVIHRIFPLRYFEEALRLKELVLVSPRSWEDPFEKLVERSVITDTRPIPWKQTPLESLVRPAFGQCWSRTSESDTLWRAYSRVSIDPRTKRNRHPDEEGVRVQSTCRKLLNAVREWSPSDPVTSCFIGGIRYLPATELQQTVADRVGVGLEAFAHGAARAKLLLLKRPAFQHESEVRLIYVEHRDTPHKGLVQVPIDPNTLFDAVEFDPRLNPFERKEREAAARKLGYQNPFSTSGLYQGALMEIIVGPR
jgi:hypothetical protein